MVLHLPAVGDDKTTGEEDDRESIGQAGLFRVEVCDVLLAVFENWEACFSPRGLSRYLVLVIRASCSFPLALDDS